MFFLIGKKKWLQIMEQFQAVQEAVADCRLQLNTMQDNWRTAQSELIKLTTDGTESINQSISREFDTVRAMLEHQIEFLSAQRTAAQQARTELLQKLEDLREAMVQIQQKLDAAERSSTAIQESIQTSSTQSADAMKRHGELLSAQGTVIQEAQAELLRELEASQKMIVQIQKKLDAAETSSAAIQESIQTNSTQSADAMKRHGELLSAQGTAAQEAQAELLRKLEASQKMIVQIQEKLDAAETSSVGIQESIQTSSTQSADAIKRHGELLSTHGIAVQEIKTELLRELEGAREMMVQIQQKLDAAEISSALLHESIQAGSTQTAAEMTRIGKELSEQLMLLDESNRLLLLHTVMNELGGK